MFFSRNYPELNRIIFMEKRPVPFTKPERNGAKFILLHSKDNVLICCAAARKGDVVNIDGEGVMLLCDMAIGHKIARQTLGKACNIIKSGAPVGSLICAVVRGEHIHLHNMKSDYIPSHTRKASGENTGE